MTHAPVPTTRRALLSGVAGVAVSAAGCLSEIRRAADRGSPESVSLDIYAPPSDDDPHALRIANHLASNLERAGVSANVEPIRTSPFLSEILYHTGYDLYVWKLPGQDDPDVLRPLLHSRFSEEPGWQNPFGLSSRTIDQYLDEQIRGGTDRMRVVHDLQREIDSERPFIPLVVAEEQRVIRTDRFQLPRSIPFHDPLWVYDLAASDDGESTIRLGTTDGRVTHNLNPIAPEYREPGDVTDLLYEPLVRRVEGDLVPWVASEWEWVSPGDARAPTLNVDLRTGLRWHDGEPLTAEDVAFTYQFLADTSMTDEDPIIPAPRFRGQTTIVDSIDDVSALELRIQFIETSHELAMRALNVPILPKHVWEEHTDITEVAGIQLSDLTTNALVIDNLEPVGSGPYEVDQIDMDREIRLERYSDHFLNDSQQDDQIPGVPSPSVDAIVLDVRPSISNLANAVVEGDLDGCISSIGPTMYRDLTNDHDSIDGATEESNRVYHVGVNLRESPLTNHRFRFAVASLLDRTYIADEIFDGAARPTIAPIVDESLVPSGLDWRPEADTFAGEPGTGEADAEPARENFRAAGFQYASDGSLLSR